MKFEKKVMISGLYVLMIPLLMACSQTFNDVPAMESKIAKELDIELVSIFDIKDIDEYRFVGYTYENKLGFACFKQNKERGYEFEYLRDTDRMRSRSENIFYLPVSWHMIFLNNNENLHTIKRKTTYKFDSSEELEVIEVTGSPSIIIFDLIRGSHKSEYTYYDDNGDLIE